MLERGFELESAAADVLEIGSKHSDRGFDWNRGSWLVDALFLDENSTSEDQSLCAFAGDCVTAFDQQLVEASFHRCKFSFALNPE